MVTVVVFDHGKSIVPQEPLVFFLRVQILHYQLDNNKIKISERRRETDWHTDTQVLPIPAPPPSLKDPGVLLVLPVLPTGV